MDSCSGIFNAKYALSRGKVLNDCEWNKEIDNEDIIIMKCAFRNVKSRTITFYKKDFLNTLP